MFCYAQIEKLILSPLKTALKKGTFFVYKQIKLQPLPDVLESSSLENQKDKLETQILVEEKALCVQ